MQGEKEDVRETTEGSGQQREVTPHDDPNPNPVGQDSARNEYGEIGEDASRSELEFGGRQSHTEGAGFILRQDKGASEEEDEDIRPS